MSLKWKWLLGVSLVLNLFLIAAICGAGFVIRRHMHDLKGPTGVAQQWRDADQALGGPSRERIHAIIRQAALAGEPDLTKARDIRAMAAKLAEGQPYDAAKITALSGEARGYEDQARAKVENALIQGIAPLTPKERSVVASRMLRASFRFRHLHREHDHGASYASDRASSLAP